MFCSTLQIFTSLSNSINCFPPPPPSFPIRRRIMSFRRVFANGTIATVQGTPKTSGVAGDGG